MLLEEFKTAWQKQKVVGYSQEELNSIYHIKQVHKLEALKGGFSIDLLAAILISVIFIVVLQVLNFKTSDFWSACMGILAIQHVLFYQFQLYLLKRYSVFAHDVGKSLSTTINKIKALLWFYRLWPAFLTIILFLIYSLLFKPDYPVWQLFLTGSSFAAIIGFLSNIVSAILVRKQLLRLEALKQELVELRDK